HVGNVARLILRRVEYLPLPRGLGIHRRGSSAGGFRWTVEAVVIEPAPLLAEGNGAVETPVFGGGTITTGFIPRNFRHVGQGRAAHHAWRGGKILAGSAVEHIGGIRAAHRRHVCRGGERVGVETGADDSKAVEVRIGTGISGGNEDRDAFGVRLRPHQVDRRLAGAV